MTVAETGSPLRCPRCGRRLPANPDAAFCPYCTYQYRRPVPWLRAWIALIRAAEQGRLRPS